MNNLDKEFLVVDIETTSLDISLAEVKVFGAYDPKLNKYFVYDWTDENIGKVMMLLNEYNYVVTFNGAKYDLPILERHGVPTSFKHIDVFQVFKYQRRELLPNYNSYSLKNLTLSLGLDGVGKGTIDYEVFKKDTWTTQERELIEEYLKQDLLSTWKLMNYLLTKFDYLKKYLSEKDQLSYKYLTTSLTTYAYKVICNGAGITELYDEKPTNKVYPGPYTSTPRKKELDNVTLLKIKYLYAEIVAQFNLESYNCTCCKTNEGMFHGKNVYEVKGYYCQKKQGKLERYLVKLISESNKNPESKLVADIVLYHLYDVLTNAKYYATFNYVLPMDLLALVKYHVNALLNALTQTGLYVLYVDEEDVFIKIPEGKTMSDVEAAINKTLSLLKSRMTYPNEYFNVEITNGIKLIKFVNKGSDANKVFMYKGIYAYITSDGLVKYKGMNKFEAEKLLGVGEL